MIIVSTLILDRHTSLKFAGMPKIATVTILGRTTCQERIHAGPILIPACRSLPEGKDTSSPELNSCAMDRCNLGRDHHDSFGVGDRRPNFPPHGSARLNNPYSI
jgi:hypothetical protein